MIRPAGLADIPEIFILRTSVRENYMSILEMLRRMIWRRTIIPALQSGTLGVWVKEDRGKIAAFSMADKRDGHIFALFTRPGYEKTGHGTALLRTCEAWLKQNGLRRAELETLRNTNAHRFYLKQGWHELGSPPDDEHSVLLEKLL